jgi:hypothetical protein
MQIIADFSYRYAKKILQVVAPSELADIQSILNDRNNVLRTSASKTQQDYSAQIKRWFVSQKAWKCEHRRVDGLPVFRIRPQSLAR